MKLKTIFLSAIAPLAIALPVKAQTEALCASEPVNVRASVQIPRWQDPAITLQRQPLINRAVIRTLAAGQCVVTQANSRNYFYQSGYRWVNVVLPGGATGWVASEFLYEYSDY